jgi:hypothetical protein
MRQSTDLDIRERLEERRKLRRTRDRAGPDVRDREKILVCGRVRMACGSSTAHVLTPR